MSAVAARRPAATVHCPRCGTRLQPRQDWCLECGTAATTRVLPPPSWIVPAAIVAGAVAITAAGVAIAVSSLSNQANRDVPERAAAPAPAAPAHHRTVPKAKPKPKPKPKPATTTPTATSTTTTSTTAAKSAAGHLATWPAGKTAWTVILITTDQSGAEKTAKLYAQKGVDAGVIPGAKFQGLSPSYWLVFSGQFATQAQAEAHVKAVASRTGQHGYATQLKPK